MVVLTEGSVQGNSRIAYNNAIDVYVGKSAFEANVTWYEPRTAWYKIKYYLSASEKIERVADQISVSRFWKISQILDVLVCYFFMMCHRVSLKVQRVRSTIATKILMAMAINCVIRWSGVKHWN